MSRRITYFTSEFVIPMQARTTAFMASVAARGVILIEPYITRLNRWYYYLDLSGDLTNMDYKVVYAMIDTDYSEADRKIITGTDLIDPSRWITLKDDFVGSHVGGVGFEGNGSNFAILHPFNPSTATNYSRNSAKLWYLCLSDSSINNISDLASSDGAFSVINVAVKPHINQSYNLINSALSLGTYTYQIPRAYNHQWRRFERVSSSLINEYDNGMLVGINTDASVALTNDVLSEFGIYYGGAWYPGLYGDGLHGSVGAGSSLVDVDYVEYITRRELLAPIDKASYFNKNIVAIGDSIFSSQSQGEYSAMYQQTITALNDSWTLSNLAVSGKYANDVNTEFASKIQPYFVPYYDKNIMYVAIGTNDIANGATGSALYTIIKTFCTLASNAGWTVVISGIMDRTASLGVSQATFDTEVAAYHTLMKADFNVVHGTIAHYRTSNLVTWAHGFVCPIDDATFADANDTAIFPDNIHLSATGRSYYSINMCQPIILTL